SFQMYNMITKEKLINCGICKKQFNDPRILPCSHTYCLRCIKQIASNHSEYFECPQYDGAIVPKDSIDTLKVNQTINDIIEFLNFSSGLISCTNCNSTTSETWCNNCTTSYCARCCQDVHRIRAFQNHQLISLREKSIELMSCESHQDEILKYWCLKCDTCVCSDCLLNDHKEHPYILIHKAAKDFETKVNIDLSNIELSLNKNINQTDASISIIKDEHESKKVMINNSMNFLQRIIDEHEKEILEKIQNIDENNNKLMEDFKNRLQNELEDLEKQKLTLEILRSSKNPMKIMRARQEFIDYINRRNRILQGLQLPTKHTYRIEGIDQVQNVREHILQCGQFIDSVKHHDETITYHNPQLEKLIADNQMKQEWNFERKILIDEDMKILADALQNNTVRKKKPLFSFIVHI
ncbi:unnamed protein product, partial [Rotaria sp. Silwood2]